MLYFIRNISQQMNTTSALFPNGTSLYLYVKYYIPKNSTTAVVLFRRTVSVKCHEAIILQ